MKDNKETLLKGQKATISGGYWNPLGKWKIGDTVTIKEVFEDSVSVEEFFGRLPKSEIQVTAEERCSYNRK